MQAEVPVSVSSKSGGKKNSLFNPRFELLPFPREGELLATFVEQYASAICEKMLPAMQLTAAETNQLAEIDQQYLQPESSYTEYSWNGDKSFEEHGFELTALQYAKMERNHLIRHMLGLGFTGLFHVFERQVLEVLRRLHYRRDGGVLPTKDKDIHMSIDDYMDLLARGGHPIVGDVETSVARVRLISNVMKHGSPASIKKLHARFPTLFWNSEISLEFLGLTSEMLIQDAHNIARYWREFPHENITLGTISS